MDTAQLVIKWNPLLDGLPPDSAGLVAQVLEDEARYLREGLSDGARSELLGPFLKYIFPLIRRVVPKISVLDRVAFGDDKSFSDFMFRMLMVEFLDILSAKEHMVVNLDERDSVLTSDVLIGLADRIAVRYRSLVGVS